MQIMTKEIIEARTRCADLCYEFNNLRPSDTEKQQELLKKILGKMEEAGGYWHHFIVVMA